MQFFFKKKKKCALFTSCICLIHHPIFRFKKYIIFAYLVVHDLLRVGLSSSAIETKSQALVSVHLRLNSQFMFILYYEYFLYYPGIIIHFKAHLPFPTIYETG